MRAGLVVLGACVLAGVAGGCGGGHAAFNENCGTPREGGLTLDLKWETSGPWHVSMSYATARSIALRVGPYEFQPATSHPAPQDVPCDAASTVALAGANAWTHWHSEHGSFIAGWTGYATGPSYGRFDCTGTKRRDGGAVETCSHRADKHAGEITVRFTIMAFKPR